MWENWWDTGTLTYSTQHNNFPATQTRHRWHTFPWRTRYGANSGWGQFIITASSNDRIDFEDSGLTTRVASLTPATYTADTLASHIETQMEAVTTDNFTVSYSDSVNKFVITNDTGTFELLWNSGSNKSRSAAGTLGYDDTADDTGAASYTADYLRIHTEEWLKLDLGSAKAIKCFGFKFHNLSSTATARIQLNNADTWSSPNVDQPLTITSGITIYFWETAQTQQWVRLQVKDIDNSDGYIEIGRCNLSTFFEPSVNFRRDYTRTLHDPSEIMLSDGGQLSSNKKNKYQSYNLNFEYISDSDVDSFVEMWDYLGITKDFFFTRDRDNAGTTSHYARLIRDIQIQHIIRDELFSVSLGIEELR
jgi:hypothetical protein